MEIKLGHYYEARNGDVFGPIIANKEGAAKVYPWTSEFIFRADERTVPVKNDGHMFTWTQKGHMSTLGDCEFDLIRESLDPRTMPPPTTKEKPKDEIDTNHVISVGFWKTRDGRKACVLCVDAPGCKPAKGYVISGNGESYSCGWFLTGRYNFSEQCPQDLMEPWRDPVKFEKIFWADCLREARDYATGFTFRCADHHQFDGARKYRLLIEEMPE